MVIKNGKHFIDFHIKLTTFLKKKKQSKFIKKKKIFFFQQGSKNKFKSSNPSFKIFIDSANFDKFYFDFDFEWLASIFFFNY